MSNFQRNLHIDINADLGEGFGVYQAGDDAAMLKIVTSANIACGFHAGDPEIMASTFLQAKDHNVNVGAHPGYPDLPGFGRRTMAFKPAEIERIIAYQVGAAQALSAYAGNPITYVKAHGALGNLTNVDEAVATAVCRAVKAVDPSLICMTFAGGLLDRIGRDMGLRTCAEIFADRAYTAEGRVVPRSQPGAMIEDPDEAAQRVVRMIQKGAIETIEGTELRVPIDTVCVHGDSAHSVSMAREVRRQLEAAGVEVRRFV
ncbi:MULTISPECIES: 5-oxoprolinase subunit PxpA [unclassified Cupriavidus]|uniref:LamB/YcsF family protein n=1 Tax=unclassified Cupriavidus TaxID=2640874 RepID=UPI001C003B8F|nr:MULTISPECIES: 5-oxoprolinase subunit PxpA [unclassified Cupriavidus]MCA3187691.1 LamB/YcsF family protein [Cupriavidus sp.]MCA3189118.1 LamB/YcsF family protein [Cupriavidus sp.]MCA3198838.1 LamB/YcsF family protein [Cupriavidus sp.]MCA3201582.1 LamB/YcsF family protein [Cupriavidus sp.]MCA3230873.1 LamB/YcsF family protein [Cupriavidus sp.]